MNSLLQRLSPVLHLTRVTTAFAAVANVWFVVLWTRASPVEDGFAPDPLRRASLWVLLGAAALYAVALFSFAVALNDTLDVRRDRALHPERPLPSGRLTVESAVALVAGTLLAAAVGAAALGLPAVLMFLLTAGATLFYDAVGKYFPSVGLVVLGLIYGAHMMTPNPHLVFVWPVLLVMTHAVLVGIATHLLGRKRPTLTVRMLIAAGAGWAFWSGVLLYVGWLRAGSIWPAGVRPLAALGPALLAITFGLYAWQKARMTPEPARAADKIRRYGALWAAMYGAAWMLGMGYLPEAAILGALTLVGVLGMTVLREVYGLFEHPIGYRR